MRLLRDVLTCHDASVIPLDARQADYSRVGLQHTHVHTSFRVHDTDAGNVSYRNFSRCSVTPINFKLTTQCFSTHADAVRQVENQFFTYALDARTVDLSSYYYFISVA